MVNYKHVRTQELQEEFNSRIDKMGAKGAAVRDIANKFYVTCFRRNPADRMHCPFPEYLVKSYDESKNKVAQG